MSAPGVTLEALVQKVSEAFSLVKTEADAMTIEYDDADGDRITVGRDQPEREMEAMLKELVRNKCLFSVCSA